jgi:hypothetical protein
VSWAQGDRRKRVGRRVDLLAIACGVLLAAVALAEGPSPEGHGGGAQEELEQLLQKAGRYVVEYESAFSHLVAEETYEQQTRELEGGARRHLRSDIVFVTLEWPFPWGAFRDVFEVDGAKVRDREARLEKLLARNGAPDLAQVRAIRDESARYNIGLYRDINEPTVPLLFLHPTNQPRFRFELKGRRRFSGAEGREVAFEEVTRPTVIRWERRDDLPARGSFWLEQQTGVVLRSECWLDLPYELGINYARTARIVVEYAREPRLGLWVPVQMEESYPDVLARARYSGYRRMTVETQETVHPPRAKRRSR